MTVRTPAQKEQRYPCVCCGYLTLSERPGSYEICKICFWEDDEVHLRDPRYAGGPNRVPLVVAQRNFIEHGVSELRFKTHVRPPRKSDVRDPGWRPIDLNVDDPDQCLPKGGWRTEGPSDLTHLYWWRPTYWRRSGQ
jgi:hypothetical protein